MLTLTMGSTRHLENQNKVCSQHTKLWMLQVLPRQSVPRHSHQQQELRSVQGLLLVGGDGHIGGGVGHAGQDEALAHLVVIKERLVGLVNTASVNLAGARRAGTSAARVGQVNAWKEKEWD